MDLSDKVAIVTGASSGIGEATARHLGELGATVVLVARRKERLEKLAKDLIHPVIIEADLTDKKACERTVEKVIKNCGRIDILVNNAGMMLLGPVLDAPTEEWDKMVDINLNGLMYLTRAALPHMRKAKSGHIINISSVAGRVAKANSAVYNATKWGVNAFTEALRQELAEWQIGIKTTLIEPGAVETELASHNRPEIQEVLEKRWSGIPKKLQSDDIARAIVYAVTQPKHVAVNEILIRPTDQPM